MATAPSRSTRAGDILPRLVLEPVGGGPVLTVPGNQATLLVFVHPGGCQGCQGYLTGELAGAVADLQAWGTRLVAVGAALEAGVALPFAVAADPDGATRRRLGMGDEAAVLLTDRWGEVMEMTTVGSDHGFPLLRQLVESAKIVDLSCGECNVPGPEWREPDA